MNKQLIFFILISCIAIFLRFYQVDTIPPGINRDEGSIGYTAYSLLLTGKDEYGKSFPISFQSFGDWKLPLYLYSVVPMVWLFGLSEISVRLTSIIAGIGTVLLTYFLVYELIGKRSVALLTMGLIAVSPWHLHLSRVESESNTAVFFVTLGTFLFLKGLHKNTWVLIPSFVLFALTYYTYAGNYIFTTLLVIILTFIYRKEVIKAKKEVIIGGGLFVLLSLFIFSQTVFGPNTTKLSGIGIFGDPSVVHAKIEIPRNEHSNPNPVFIRLVHNKVVFAAERFTQNYLNAFSPDFLFIKGGGNRAHNIQGFGNMYLVEALFFFLGIAYLIFARKTKSLWLVLLWIAVAPLAASITKDAPHTNRMFAIFPMLPLVTALGIERVYEILQKKYYQKLFVFLLGMLFFINIALYIDRYFVHFPKNEAESWGIGYKQLVHVLASKEYSDMPIVMSRSQYSPYIFILFYSQYNPLLYQKEAIRHPLTNDGFLHVRQFDRFEFREIDWDRDMKLSKTIIIAHPSEIPEEVMREAKNINSVTLPDGKTMFILLKTQ